MCQLGAGSFGVVQKCVNSTNGGVYAMKTIEKARVIEKDMGEQVKREVLTQLKVKHKNLVRLHYYFEDAARIYCLLEFADQGQLFAYLKAEKRPLPEPRAASFFFDTARGIDYLHSLRIAHRDLKPENILLFGDELLAKVGDFGWCVELTDGPRLTFCGTLEYVSPEMLCGEPHDEAVDLWALGVLLYEMLLSHAPFLGSKKDLMDRICDVDFHIPKGSMSPGPEELIRGLLVRSGSCRMPLKRILEHEWSLVVCTAQDVLAARTELAVGDQPRPKARIIRPADTSCCSDLHPQVFPMANKFSAVLTAKQERQAGVSSANIWYTSGNSGKDLWKLKANNPELFAKQGAGDAVPPGFEETDKAGWYYNRADKIFWVRSTRQLLWFDEESGEHKELYEGQILPLAFGGGAATSSEATGAAGATGAKPVPKTVVIPDLHRVASALKTELSHVDRPAAMLGVFGGGEMTARAFPEKLVKRLGASRSCWSEEDLRRAVQKVVQEAGGGPASVVVIMGCRATAVTTDGASFRVTVRPLQGSLGLLPAPTLMASSATSSNTSLSLKDGHCLFAACSVGGGSKPGLLTEEAFESSLASQLAKGWARTGSITLLQSARQSGILEPLAVVCARLVPTEGASSEAPAKRLKTASTSPIFAAGTTGTSGQNGGKADQVRLRQILLRVAAAGPPVTDPVRRKQVKRSQEQAEAEMLDILQSLEADSMKSFQKVCRERSECQSALKGGELAGDMGWLDRVKGVGIQQDRAKQGVRPQVPAAVLKAAFELAVGEVHDLVTTEVGVHLLQRTA
ncbi:ark1 [Symbiodinium necroappetens]|uniref:Ark1 protein n=1 Tax=Symbiodinium necroappetens TaxID=1628268 RepID=A0A812MZE0_9DINO|nr:ark1 [Symbiodinium necroappetens]